MKHVFLEHPCFLHDPTDVANLISGSSAFSKSSLYILKFLAQVLLKPSLKNFECDSMWKECNCTTIRTFSGSALLWDWNESWPSPVLWPLKGFPNLLTRSVQYFNSITFEDFKQLSWNSINTYDTLDVHETKQATGSEHYTHVNTSQSECLSGPPTGDSHSGLCVSCPSSMRPIPIH